MAYSNLYVALPWGWLGRCYVIVLNLCRPRGSNLGPKFGPNPIILQTQTLGLKTNATTLITRHYVVTTECRQRRTA